MSKHPIVSNQVLYNLNRRQIEVDLLPYCQENQVTIIAYTPLDSGHLAKASSASSNPERMKVLEMIAEQTKKSVAQVALNWCTSRPGIIAIPKSDKSARVAENCGASGCQRSSEHRRNRCDGLCGAENGHENNSGAAVREGRGIRSTNPERTSL